MSNNLNEKILDETAKIYKVIGNANRIKLLYLLELNELTVNEISNQMGLSQSVISHQLAILREHQLISFKKHGKYISYKLDDPHILSIIELTFDHVSHVINNQEHQYHFGK